jgi:hypothetical protein
MTTIPEHLMLAWKMAESDTVMTSGEKGAATVVPMIEGKPLALLQVNCRGTYNKTLDFWNLTHIALML